MNVWWIVICILTFFWLAGLVWYLIYPFNFGVWLFHDIMGWHLPDETEFFDGCSEHSHCRFCKAEIMQDSQGNWFKF